MSRGINYPGQEGLALQAALPFMFAGTTWQQLSPEENNHREVGVKFAPTESTQVDISLFSDNIKNRYVYDLAFGATFPGKLCRLCGMLQFPTWFPI